MKESKIPNQANEGDGSAGQGSAGQGDARQGDARQGDGIRLQLWLARAGIASRRQSEAIILSGRVTVNGKTVAELGTKVLPGDEVCLDGKRLKLEERLRYILLNKPVGYLSSMDDPEGRRLAIDLIADIPERIYNVGRLDLWSSGLLLFTNDGELARALSHPSCGIEKEYEVRTDLPIPNEFLVAFRRGVEIEGVVYKAKVARRIDEKSARIILVEGKNREIRRVVEHFGLKTLALSRIRMGPIELGNLLEGKYRELLPEEVSALRSAIR